MTLARVVIAGLIAMAAAGCGGPPPAGTADAARTAAHDTRSSAGQPAAAARRDPLPARPVPRPARTPRADRAAADPPRASPDGGPAPTPSPDRAEARTAEATPGAGPDRSSPGTGTQRTPPDAGADIARVRPHDPGRAAGTGRPPDPGIRDWLPGPDPGDPAALRDKSGVGGREADLEARRRARAFAGSTIRNCNAIRQLGRFIAAGRSRGEGESDSIGRAVERLTAEYDFPDDQRTRFTGRVYGILIYRLDAGHSTQLMASYTHAVCRVFRETNRTIPVDPLSERLMNDWLAACDRVTARRLEMDECVLLAVRRIVERSA